MPHMRHVLPDRQFHRHVSRLGALGERVGIIEQRFDGAHLDQTRRKTAETCLDTFSLQGASGDEELSMARWPSGGLKNAHWAHHDFFASMLPGWI
jgi:hypothetical protein